MRLRVSLAFDVFLSFFYKMCLNVFECVCLRWFVVFPWTLSVSWGAVGSMRCRGVTLGFDVG